jgi:exodeoxyribonuclease VII small subunit
MMAQKRFEEAMERLEEIVRDLEEGDLPLEESLKAFEEGMNLIKFCSQKLEEVEKKVTMLVKASEGEYRQEPFEVAEKDED